MVRVGRTTAPLGIQDLQVFRSFCVEDSRPMKSQKLCASRWSYLTPPQRVNQTKNKPILRDNQEYV